MELEKENYRFLLDKLPHGYVCLHVREADNLKDFIIVDINDAFSEMIGMSAKEIVGQKIADVLPEYGKRPDYLSHLYKQAKRCSDTLSFEEYHSTLKRVYELTVWSSTPGSLELLFYDKTLEQEKESLQRNVRRFRALVENMREGIVVEDDRRTILLTNRAFCKIFSIPLTPGSLAGSNCAEAADQAKHLLAEPDLFSRRIERIIDARQPVYGEEIYFADGRVFERDYIPVFSENRTFIGHMWKYRDISQRIQTEKDLRESKKKYQNLVENINEVVYILDKEARVRYISPNIETISGYTPEEVLGKLFVDFVHPADKKGRFEQFRKILSGVDEPSEYRFLTREGQVVWIRTSARPILRRGKPVGVQGILFDITDRKEAEESLKRQLELEAIIADISSAFINMPALQADKGIERALQILGTFFDVDHAHVFQFSPDEKKMSITHEWCAKNAQPQKGLIDNYEADNFPWWAEQMQRLQSVHIPDVENLPGKAFHDKKEFKRHYIQSLLTVPITLAGKLYGFLAFDTVQSKQHWNDEEIRMLTIVAEIIGRTLDKQEASEKMRKNEEQLRRAQKMESIGRLAGGVAHDYNNMLSVINGYAEIALNKIDPDNSLYPLLEKIREAADYSAKITRQLLAFARKQTVEPKVIDLNEIVGKALKMLRRLLNEDIEINWIPDENVPLVSIDPTQIEQILVNLCVNAQDAMKDGGIISIETGKVSISKSYRAKKEGIVPGEYALLSVRDNGEGMSPRIMQNIFEPYFTTKGEKRGTGLGLATVFGIVKQNNGFIDVDSEPGKGSTLYIYLPTYNGRIEKMPVKSCQKSFPGKGDTILLLEDEPEIREMGKEMLEILGYKVVTAATGQEALDIVVRHGDSVDLLVTDVVMPRMNGYEVARQIQNIRPGMRVLFISGYPAEVIAQKGVLKKEVNFLHKPFSLKDMERKINEVLHKKEDRGREK